VSETVSPDSPQPETLDLLGYGDEEDLVEAAVAYAQNALPEWTPRAGNVEVVLLEALALELGLEVMALREAPGVVLEQLLELYGVRRDPGAPASGVARFTVSGSRPLVEIPAGARLRAQVPSTGESYDFLTTGRLEINTVEGLSAEVRVVAEESGREANRLPAGSALSVVDNLPQVESVLFAEGTIGGRSPEDDGQLYSRGAAVLARQVSTLVLPTHFELASLATAGVGRAHVLDLYDPAAPTVETPGHVTVAVADLDGQPLLEQAARDLEFDLEQQALASLTIHVVSPTYTDLDLEVTVQSTPRVDAQLVAQRVEARLREWLAPSRWGWGSSVEQFQIVSTVGAVDGVDFVVEAPATIDLAGDAPLPRLEAVTVNVQEP